MANKKYRLTNDYWETTGIYDNGLGKTQRVINNSVIGNTTMGTTATSITGAIKEHNDKIGNTTMGTTATTITGAIAEHEGDISDLNGAINSITPFTTVPTANSTKGITSGGLAAELNSRLCGKNLASGASEVVPRLAGASAIVYAVRASSSQTPCLWLCDQWGGIVPVVQNTDMASLEYDSTNLRFILTNNGGGYINFGYVFFKTYS